MSVIAQVLYPVYRFSLQNKMRGSWRIREALRPVMRNHITRARYLNGYVHVRPGNSMEETVACGGVYDRNSVDAIQYFAAHDFSFVDCGANVGLMTVAAGLANPDLFGMAFEPEPRCFGLLQRNIQLNGFRNVTPRQVALGDVSGSTTLNLSTTKNQGKHSLLPRTATVPGPQVAISTLDAELKDNPHFADNVLIKVDTEGYEPQVVEGGKSWLASLATAAVLIEVNATMLAMNTSGVPSLHDQLAALGFERFTSLALDSGVYNDLYIKGERARTIAKQLPNAK